MRILIALAGCKAVEQSDAPVLVIEPPAIDFGAVKMGETGTATVALRNEGGVAVAFDGAVASSDAVIVDDAGAFELAPGAEEVRTVTWTASTLYGVNERVDLVVGGVAAVRIPVTGSSSWAALEVSRRHIEFVEANVACESWVDLTVSNGGTGDEAVTAIEVTGPSFSVTSAHGDPVDLPLTVGAQSEQILRVHFAPVAAKPASGTLVIDSESTPELAVIDLSGEGQPVHPDTRTWTVEYDEAVTGILNVNEELVTTDWFDSSARLDEFFSAFFGALLDAPAPFRIAIVMNEDGHVDGPAPYIDQSFSVDKALVVTDAMLDAASQHGDNDHGMETCLRALEANEDWLLDEGVWLDSNLNLVVLNHDQEQSPNDVAHYVDRYLERKTVGDVAVHGIAGDVPDGCQFEESTSGALPSVNLHEATVQTGGAFLSICEPDWTEWGRTLAWRFTDPYVLDGAPWITSIEVFVDGEPVSSGWSYDSATHELTFDDASTPGEGAELRIDYARCD